MTPRRFSFLLKRYERRTKQEDRRAGAVIAALYNIHTRESDTDPLKGWQDFFPEWKEQKPIQTEDQMFQAMMMWTKSTEGLSH